MLPRFARPDHGMFAALTLAWLSLYSVVLRLAGRWFRGSRVRHAIDGVAGVVLLGLGARVATAQR